MAEFHKINLLKLHVGMWERGIVLKKWISSFCCPSPKATTNRLAFVIDNQADVRFLKILVFKK